MRFSGSDLHGNKYSAARVVSAGRGRGWNAAAVFAPHFCMSSVPVHLSVGRETLQRITFRRVALRSKCVMVQGRQNYISWRTCMGTHNNKEANEMFRCSSRDACANGGELPARAQLWCCVVASHERIARIVRSSNAGYSSILRFIFPSVRNLHRIVQPCCRLRIGCPAEVLSLVFVDDSRWSASRQGSA